MRPDLIKGLSHRVTLSRMLVSKPIRQTSPVPLVVPGLLYVYDHHHTVEGHIGPEASITFSPPAITITTWSSTRV